MQKEIVVTRVFNAPVTEVWKIWTEPELVKRWWGPAHFTCSTARIDFREGAVSLVSMEGPAGSGFGTTYSLWKYRKIVPHERIEFVQSLADKNGKETRPVLLGMPDDFPEQILTVVTFKPVGTDQTEMSVTEYADMGSMTDFAIRGLQQTMDKIAKIFSA